VSVHRLAHIFHCPEIGEKGSRIRNRTDEFPPIHRTRLRRLISL